MMKKILIISLSLVFVCLVAVVVFLFFHPIQIPMMPSDDELIGELFNQKLPGFSEITILDRQGKGNGGEPRLLTLRVSMDTGQKPVLCEGKLIFFISDPSFLNFNWNTLQCEGQDYLVKLAQFALQGRRDYRCHQEKIASLLAYWIENDKVSIKKIKDPNLYMMVENILEENTLTPDQIIMLDLSKMKTKDFDPSLPDQQKLAQYVLRCDGTIEQYLAKENTTIYSQVILEEGVFLTPPFERP